MMRLLRALFEIQSPSAVILGTASPTPRWVRAVWAVYDSVVEVASWLRSLIVLAAACAVLVAALACVLR